MQDIGEFFKKHTYSQLCIIAKGTSLLYKKSRSEQEDNKVSKKYDWSNMTGDEFLKAIQEQGGLPGE